MENNKNFIDYYQVLGIKPNATQQEIKTAYRLLAKKYHPDANPGVNTQAKMELINNAKDHLYDPEARMNYDATYRAYYEELRQERIYRQQEEEFKQRSNASWQENNSYQDYSSYRKPHRFKFVDSIVDFFDDLLYRIDSYSAIITIILSSLAAAGGISLVVLFRDNLNLNFTSDVCQTFPLAMHGFVTWLILPASALLISAVFIIPSVFDHELFSIILTIAFAVALTALAAYFTFYINATYTNDTFENIKNIIIYVIDFLRITAATIITVSTLQIFAYNEGTDKFKPILYFLGLIVATFIFACGSYVTNSGRFLIFGIIMQLIGVLGPGILAYFSIVDFIDTYF